MRFIKIKEVIRPRLYQQTIFSKVVNKNSLVVLPTGLGKTIIALMVAVYYFNRTNSKVLFLAPTKPLVDQQKEFFEKVIDGSVIMNVLTGAVSPEKRKEIYKSSDFIFATPQVIENDIISSRIDVSDFCLVIFDEAHRAKGNYSYVFIAEKFFKHTKFLALTASPGSDKEDIAELLANLKIEHIEFREEDDPDVKEYVFSKEIVEVKVKLSGEFKEVKKLLDEVFREKKLELEKVLGESVGSSKKDILMLMANLRASIAKNEYKDDVWQAISLASMLLKIMHLIELFETQEISAVYSFFNQLYKESSKVKASDELFRSIKFREAFEKVAELFKRGERHPKLVKLKKIVVDELVKDPKLKIIIFTQFRETAYKILEILEEIKEISPVVFLGQQKKNGIGMTQRQQREVLDYFREGKYNVLISTSIGEEGLDIPKVDTVIFYETVPSAIRSIQRIGRTGRFNIGKVYLLITEGTRDVAFKYVSKRKEKAMYDILRELSGRKDVKKKRNDNNVSLLKFTSPEKFKVIVDNRENNAFKKELLKWPLNVECRQLEVGDIVISDEIGIERKTADDFIESMISKRVFEQVSNLSVCFRKPLLIIEGAEKVYSVRNLNRKTVDGVILSILLDFRVPIIFTKDIEETAYFVYLIAERQGKCKRFSLAKRKGLSEKEELEYFLAGIPGINLATSKALLKHFITVKNLVNASEKEMLDTELVGKKKARKLKEFFEREYE